MKAVLGQHYDRLLSVVLLIAIGSHHSMAYAGFDGSQVNLFVPFSLIIPAAGLIVVLVAFLIRNVNGFLRVVAHLLFTAGLLIYLFYAVLYLREFAELGSVFIRYLFALPIALGVFQCLRYVKAGPEYSGINRKALMALTAVFLPAGAFILVVVFGQNIFSSPKRAVTTLGNNQNTSVPTSLDRRRELNRTLPPPSPSPVIIFPESQTIKVLVNKESMTSKSREIDRQ